jgi:hypothetical protein
VPGCIAAGERNLVERRRIRGAAQEGIAQAALTLTSKIDQHLRKGKPVGVLLFPHILADKRGNAGVGNAEARLVVINEDEVGVILVPDVAGRLEELLLGFLLRDLS